MGLKPVTVSKLNNYIGRILGSDPLLGNIRVTGEISGVKYHSSGHVYFSLKDSASTVSCFLGAYNGKNIRYELEDGMEIIITGNITLYEPGGRYSLNVKDVEVVGQGSLQIAFEKLKEKLAAAGYFDPAHKKKLPLFPKNIGVVTSNTGAAVRDIINTIKDRNDVVSITVYPVLVQGPGAPSDIAGMIRRINSEHHDIDVIITGRGGGSIEDLWAFNDEEVAAAIYESDIPVISAVGHEIDYTIADFVADVRAKTPTEAGVIAAPDTGELRRYIKDCADGLMTVLENAAELRRLRLMAVSPEGFRNALSQRISDMRHRADMTKSQLESYSPLKIMEKGYTALLAAGEIVSSACNLDIGQEVEAVFPDGRVNMEVKSIRRNT